MTASYDAILAVIITSPDPVEAFRAYVEQEMEAAEGRAGEIGEYASLPARPVCAACGGAFEWTECRDDGDDTSLWMGRCPCGVEWEKAGEIPTWDTLAKQDANMRVLLASVRAVAAELATLRASLHKQRAEIEELRATLANERGEGAPSSGCGGRCGRG